MKSIVIYDSAYGNTETLAHATASILGSSAVRVQDATSGDVERANLIVFGSPTQGGRPTKAMQHFMDALTRQVLSNKSVATFDTRFASREHTLALGLLMKVISFAAPRMARTLHEKGARLIAEPEGFFVHDTKGPINDGELQRAKRWASSLINRNGELA